MSDEYVAPPEASGSICLVGPVKIIFYDQDFANCACPRDGEVYHGGWRASVPGRPMGIALVPASVDVQPGMDLSGETFHGFVKAQDLQLVAEALSIHSPDRAVLKFKVTYVSRRFRYQRGSAETSGVHAKAYCWLDAKET